MSRVSSATSNWAACIFVAAARDLSTFSTSPHFVGDENDRFSVRIYIINNEDNNNLIMSVYCRVYSVHTTFMHAFIICFFASKNLSGKCANFAEIMMWMWRRTPKRINNWNLLFFTSFFFFSLHFLWAFSFPFHSVYSRRRTHTHTHTHRIFGAAVIMMWILFGIFLCK